MEVEVVTGIELPVGCDVEPGVPLLLLVLHEPSKTAPMEASPASFRKSRRRTAAHAKRLVTRRQEHRLDWRIVGSPLSLGQPAEARCGGETLTFDLIPIGLACSLEPSLLTLRRFA